MLSQKMRSLVAAAAGATVLLASGATFALWQTSTDINLPTITTGQFGFNDDLEITAEDMDWVIYYDGIGTATTAVTNIDTFELTPGDVLTGSFTIPSGFYLASGTNFEYTLLATYGGFTGPASIYGVTVSFVATPTSADVHTGGVVTVSWPATAVTGTQGAGGLGIDLGSLTITLNQTR